LSLQNVVVLPLAASRLAFVGTNSLTSPVRRPKLANVSSIAIVFTIMKKPKISMQAPTIARGQMGFPCLASKHGAS
jgi:hypothetical protein